MDTDNDPSNGIRLPAYGGAFNIDFSQRIEDFENDLDVQAFLTAHAGGRPLVTVQDAIEHFSQSISTVSTDNMMSFNSPTKAWHRGGGSQFWVRPQRPLENSRESFGAVS